MRVLHIINRLSVDGGAENLVRQLILKQKSYQMEADILVLGACNEEVISELEACGIKIFRTGLSNIYSLRQIFRMKKFIKQYDIVHTHLFPSQYWYVLSKIIFGGHSKSITTEHSTYNKRRKYKILRPLEKIIYNQYNKIICISKACEEMLLQWIPSIADKTITVFNGVNTEKFKNSEPYDRQKMIAQLPIGAKLILMVGRMTPAKDFDTLIRSLVFLPCEYNLVIVGEGTREEELKALAQQLGLGERVHFLGVRNDVDRIMKSVDLFVLSSNWEGFGLVAVEAMASGLPIIASDVPGLSQVVDGYGMLFQKGDDKQLAEAIIKVFSNDDIYKNMVVACLKRAEEFCLDKMVEKYIRVYESLCL